MKMLNNKETIRKTENYWWGISVGSWYKQHPRRAEAADFKYNNSERGFIIKHLSHLFKPSRAHHRSKVWMPELSKSEIWEELFLHIQHMKDLYPRSTGRLCRYCHEPWTYLTRKTQRGPKTRKIRGTQHPTNFAIDRFNPLITYTKRNIIFCCSECNDRKHDSRLSDWKNFLRVAHDLE